MELIKSFYENSKTVRMERVNSNVFSLQVGLRQGCVMVPWILRLFMGRLLKELNGRVRDRCPASRTRLPIETDPVLYG